MIRYTVLGSHLCLDMEKKFHSYFMLQQNGVQLSSKTHVLKCTLSEVLSLVLPSKAGKDFWRTSASQSVVYNIGRNDLPGLTWCKTAFCIPNLLVQHLSMVNGICCILTAFYVLFYV